MSQGVSQSPSRTSQGVSQSEQSPSRTSRGVSQGVQGVQGVSQPSDQGSSQPSEQASEQGPSQRVEQGASQAPIAIRALWVADAIKPHSPQAAENIHKMVANHLLHGHLIDEEGLRTAKIIAQQAKTSLKKAEDSRREHEKRSTIADEEGKRVQRELEEEQKARQATKEAKDDARVAVYSARRTLDSIKTSVDELRAATNVQ